ncbi:MAG: gliding motility-associated ABC transporter ATP-binding subunit GldA [Bacteroidota bacterium]
MSILVQNLTKIYGTQKALDNITFISEKGKITGFLGPNGAGKSTTMKIATGYIGATYGKVLVDGIDVNKNPLKVKQITGYLPEHNPLYLEMYVREYLTFIASAYKIKSIKRKVDEMVALVGLEREKGKKIRALSKGYRQRVGLAQALIHDPQILILDEPTSGLDPNQLVEIRRVIKHASESKTVIFSTHIMQEVEALCDIVVIINKGKIVVNDKIDDLKSLQNNVVTYKVEFENQVNISIFEEAGLAISVGDSNQYHISSTKEDPRKAIMKIVGEYEMPLVTISKVKQSLEKVFQESTKEP